MITKKELMLRLVIIEDGISSLVYEKELLEKRIEKLEGEKCCPKKCGKKEAKRGRGRPRKNK